MCQFSFFKSISSSSKFYGHVALIWIEALEDTQMGFRESWSSVSVYLAVFEELSQRRSIIFHCLQLLWFPAAWSIENSICGRASHSVLNLKGSYLAKSLRKYSVAWLETIWVDLTTNLESPLATVVLYFLLKTLQLMVFIFSDPCTMGHNFRDKNLKNCSSSNRVFPKTSFQPPQQELQFPLNLISHKKHKKQQGK